MRTMTIQLSKVGLYDCVTNNYDVTFSAPSAPLNLTSSNADSNCITLTWNQPDICHGLLRHYDVQWSKNRVEWNMEKGDGNQTRIVIKVSRE